MIAMIKSLKDSLRYLQQTNDCIWRRSQHTNFNYTPEIVGAFEKIAEGFNELIKALEEQENVKES